MHNSETCPFLMSLQPWTGACWVLNRKTFCCMSIRSDDLLENWQEFIGVPVNVQALKKQIGEGSIGKVHLGKWRETDVAVKVC